MNLAMSFSLAKAAAVETSVLPDSATEAMEPFAFIVSGNLAGHDQHLDGGVIF